MGSVLAFGRGMLPAMALAAPAILALRLWGLRRLGKEGLSTTPGHEAGLWVFLLFCTGLGALTVVPGPEGWGPLSLERVNLIPLAVFRQGFAILRRGDGWGYLLINFVGNIVMFVPLGFFPPLLWRVRRPLLASVGTALGASLFVELCQLFQNRGTDVDDLWLNALGGLLGFLLFRLAERAGPEAVESFRVREKKGEGR